MSNPYLSTPIRDDAEGLFFHYFIVNNVRIFVQQKTVGITYEPT